MTRMRFLQSGWFRMCFSMRCLEQRARPMPTTGAIIQRHSSSMNHVSYASIAEKKMIETPVSPLITTCVVDMGNAKMSTLTRIKAEHIYVVPSTMKPRRKLTMLATGMVCVTVV